MDANQLLFDAVAKDNSELVAAALAHGASILWRNPKYRMRTALDRAIDNRSRSCVSALLTYALAHPEVDDEAGQSALVQALTERLVVTERSKEVEGKHGADADGTDDVQSSASKPQLSGGHNAPNVVRVEGKEAISAVPHHVGHSREVVMARMQTALDMLRKGDFVMVLDDESRENEGDLIMAAEKATPDKLAFLVNHTTGIVCVGMDGDRLDELCLPPMVPQNSDVMRTAFTHSVDYKHGTTTGVSASDRAATILALADSSTVASDFNRPGHIFPLRARKGGVLVRPGHTEASVDLTRLAGLAPAGVLCEVVNRDGSMARGPVLGKFCAKHGIPLLTIADIISYRRMTEVLPSSQDQPLHSVVDNEDDTEGVVSKASS